MSYSWIVLRNHLYFIPYTKKRLGIPFCISIISFSDHVVGAADYLLAAADKNAKCACDIHSPFQKMPCLVTILWFLEVKNSALVDEKSNLDVQGQDHGGQYFLRVLFR